MMNPCMVKPGRSQLPDEQIAENVRAMYAKVLDICARKAIECGEDWRKELNPSGCASNAQLWILGNCLGHDSTFETDDDLKKRIERMRREDGNND